MESVKERAIFLHVCVPGQEDNAPDFTGELVFNLLNIFIKKSIVNSSVYNFIRVALIY